MTFTISHPRRERWVVQKLIVAFDRIEVWQTISGPSCYQLAIRILAAKQRRLPPSASIRLLTGVDVAQILNSKLVEATK